MWGVGRGREREEEEERDLGMTQELIYRIQYPSQCHGRRVVVMEFMSLYELW